MSLEREILGLSVAYALLGILLLAAVTRTRLPWPVKAVAVAVTSAFYIVAFFRTEGLLGWAATDTLPPHFQLLWARSVEPNIVLDEPGAVYLWVEALDEANVPSGVPRAYRLPYSAGLARKAETARDEIMKGRPQGGRARQFALEAPDVVDAPANPAATGVEPGGDASTGSFLDARFLGGDSQNPDFGPLPAPKLPPKGEPQFTPP